MIGNDVVDLALPEARAMARNPRFLHRVFSVGERRRIRASSRLDLTLWAFWAAKETAFKVAVKNEPGTIFSPRTFRVSGIMTAESSGTAIGEVHGPGLESCHVSWIWNRRYVHCVGYGNGPSTDRGVLVDSVAAAEKMDSNHPGIRTLSRTEEASVRTSHSRRVRRLAASLLTANGLPGIEVVRPPVGGGFGPPRLQSHGRLLANTDVSLSHDGGWVAAALLLPPVQRVTGPARKSNAGRFVGRV